MCTAVVQQVGDVPFIGGSGILLAVPGIQGAPCGGVGFVVGGHVVNGWGGGRLSGSPAGGEGVVAAPLPVGALGLGGSPAAVVAVV